jgi:hypothetical protein
MTTTTVGRLRAQQQQPSSSYEYALLFDCDGVILETEELHRLAYNEAFRKFDLRVDGRPVVWSVCFVCFVLVLYCRHRRWLGGLIDWLVGRDHDCRCRRRRREVVMMMDARAFHVSDSN